MSGKSTNDTASGRSALFSNTTGEDNTASGDALLRNTTGDNNAAVGYLAGENLTTGVVMHKPLSNRR